MCLRITKFTDERRNLVFNGYNQQKELCSYCITANIQNECVLNSSITSCTPTDESITAQIKTIQPKNNNNDNNWCELSIHDQQITLATTSGAKLNDSCRNQTEVSARLGQLFGFVATTEQLKEKSSGTQ